MIGAQQETIGIVATGMDRALLGLADLAVVDGKPVPVTVADLAQGFEAVRSGLGAIEARVDQALAVSASALTADRARQGFDVLRTKLDRIGTRLHAIEAETAKGAMVLDGFADVRQALDAQGEAAGLQAETVGNRCRRRGPSPGPSRRSRDGQGAGRPRHECRSRRGIRRDHVRARCRRTARGTDGRGLRIDLDRRPGGRGVRRPAARPRPPSARPFALSRPACRRRPPCPSASRMSMTPWPTRPGRSRPWPPAWGRP